MGLIYLATNRMGGLRLCQKFDWRKLSEQLDLTFFDDYKKMIQGILKESYTSGYD